MSRDFHNDWNGAGSGLTALGAAASRADMQLAEEGELLALTGEAVRSLKLVGLHVGMAT